MIRSSLGNDRVSAILKTGRATLAALGCLNRLEVDKPEVFLPE
jgi:hypothetical protein